MIKLKNLLIESPLTGTTLAPEARTELQKFLEVKINDDEFLGHVRGHLITDDLFYIQGLAGGMYDQWIALFKKELDGTNDLCFASGLKSTNWNIDDLPTYQVKFSSKFCEFRKRLASLTYLEFVSKHPKILTSDTTLSTEGVGVWQELLTRPHLPNRVEIFCWDIEKKEKVPSLDWKDVFGEKVHHANIVIALKTKSL